MKTDQPRLLEKPEKRGKLFSMPLQTLFRSTLLLLACCLPAWTASLPPAAFQPSEWAALQSSRADRRHTSSRGIVQTMLEQSASGMRLSARHAP